jgi:DNA-binding SARP family transcriptional activator
MVSHALAPRIDMDKRIAHYLQQSLASEEAGDMPAALWVAQEALALARQSGDGNDLAASLANLAQVQQRLGHYDECRTLAEQALGSGGSSPGHVLALDLLGVCAAESHDVAAAEGWFQRAVDLARQIGDRWGLAQALHNQAVDLHMPRGRFDLALATMDEAHRLKLSQGYPDWGHAFLQAYIHLATGNRAGARHALQELAEVVKPGSRIEGGYCWMAAHQAMGEDDLEAAGGLLRRARSIGEATGNPELQVWVRAAYSRWHRLQGDPQAALTWADDALAHARRLGYRHLEGQCLIERGRAAWQAGQQARRHRETDGYDGLTGTASQSRQFPCVAQPAARDDWQAAEAVLEPLGCAYDLAVSGLLLAVTAQHAHAPGAEDAWLAAMRRISAGGYGYLLEQERALAFPVVAAHLRSKRPEVQAAAEDASAALAQLAPAPLRVHCLGRFAVWQGARRIADAPWRRRRAGELFRYLLVSPDRRAVREVLMEALWPAQPPTSALALLHQATSALRRILEPDLPVKFPSRYVAVEGDWVILHLPHGSTIDYEQFAQALAPALADTHPEPLARALALYTGEPFPLDRYADWAVPHRERLAQRYVEGHLALARAQLAAGQLRQALESCRLVLQQAPWHEEAVLLGMQGYLALGDRPGALRLYRDLQQILRQEFDLSPRPDLQALVTSLR